MLADLDAQVTAAETAIAGLLPGSAFATLGSVPGWGTVRMGNYGAAVGDPFRWPGPAQIYRASGLSPTQYESAGTRRDGAISREGKRLPERVSRGDRLELPFDGVGPVIEQRRFAQGEHRTFNLDS